MYTLYLQNLILDNCRTDNAVVKRKKVCLSTYQIKAYAVLEFQNIPRIISK